MKLQSMNVETLAQKVMNQEPLFILDVRNEQAFSDWKIEGKSVENINVPYMTLLDGVDPLIEKLPKDKRIVVVCAKEGTSVFIGDMLVEAGLKDVHYLKGGMSSWSDHIEPVKIGDLSSGGEVYQFVRIGKGCLSYMIISNNEAIIIDPIRTIDPFIAFADKMNAKIIHVVDTHLHADHISGARNIREQTGATYWLPAQDAEEVTFSFEHLEEGRNDLTFNNSNVDIKIMYSPGHTIGSTSLIIDHTYFFTGDILFIDSIGRPDLAGEAGEWAFDLRSTLYNTYQDVAKEVTVLPAHFGTIEELNNNGSVAKTFDEILERNTSMNIKDTEQFHALVSENLPEQPNSFVDIRQTNMGKVTPTSEEQHEMEIGPNRCAING